MSVEPSTSQGFHLLNKSAPLDPDDLLRNDGKIVDVERVIPRNSPLRREKWHSALPFALRDGLSNFVVSNVPVDAYGHVSLRLSVCEEVYCGALADALERGVSFDLLSRCLASVPSVPRLLLAPLVRALVVPGGASESDVACELRRAEYVDLAMARYVVNQELTLLRDQIEKDVPRTIPRGFEDFLASPRIALLMKRLLENLVRANPLAGYLQGMGDVAAVFVITFAEAEAMKGSLSEVDLWNVEADAFAAALRFFQRFNVVFADVLDAEAMKDRMGLIGADLLASNPALFSHLERHEVDLQFFMHRFNFVFLTRELPLRSCQQLFVRYLAVPPEIDVVRIHTATCVAVLNITLSATLLRLNDFGDIMIAAQSAPLMQCRDGLIDPFLVAEAEHVMSQRKILDRHLEALFLLSLFKSLEDHPQQEND